MKILFFWTLYILDAYAHSQSSNTSQLKSTRANHKSPFEFTLKRKPLIELETQTGVDKRSVMVREKVHEAAHIYYIEFLLGDPSIVIEAHLHFKYRGTYVAMQTNEQRFDFPTLPTLHQPDEYDSIFAPIKSSTFHRDSFYFATSSPYFGQTIAAYAEDDITMGSVVFEKYHFLLLLDPTLGKYSVIGLGLSKTESDHFDDLENEGNTNIFKQMREKGWITKDAFSIWLGSYGSSSGGVVLFSHFDRKYASSDMYIFPLVRMKDEMGYFIKLDAINFLHGNGSVTEVAWTSVPIEIDISMVYSTFPKQIVQRFYESYNVSSGQVFKVECYTESERGAVGLVFSGVQFVFPFHMILYECLQYKLFSDPVMYPGERFVLGSNFLIRLYMVFDIENRQVALAIARSGMALAFSRAHAETISQNLPGISAPFYDPTTYLNTYEVLNDDPEAAATPKPDIFQTSIVATLGL